MSFKNGHWNYFEGFLMRCFQIYWTCGTRIHCVQPSSGTNTPRIARLQSRESICWFWGNQIVALTESKFQELLCNNAAHSMRTSVRRVRIALAISKPSGHWVTRTGIKRFSKYVQAGLHDSPSMDSVIKSCIELFTRPLFECSQKTETNLKLALGSKAKSYTDE